MLFTVVIVLLANLALLLASSAQDGIIRIPMHKFMSDEEFAEKLITSAKQGLR